MKLQSIKYIFLAIAFSSYFTSCDVERLPYNVIDKPLAFSSVDDASYWSNILYAQIRSRTYGEYMYSTDVQADQLNASSDFGNRSGSPHRWDFTSDDYTLSDVWSGYYEGIDNINLMLEGFQEIKPANEAETKRMTVYTGEAHLARAFYYFNLVTRYAKIYDPATAATDLGVPIVILHDMNNKPARSTVKQVYDLILKDIETAKTNLATVNGARQANRFTIDAVRALEARVKLYMQDWPGARTAAEALITGGKYPLYSTEMGIKNMWHRDEGAEDIFSPTIVKPTELPPTNGLYLYYDISYNTYSPDFIPSKWVIDEFEDTDFRKKTYFITPLVYLAGRDFRNITIVNKYPGNPVYFTSAATNYVHKQKVFRIAEMYLIAAEAGFREGGAQLTTAVGHLNALRVARGLKSLNPTISGQDLFNEIKKERFRELAFEGFRLDDLRRWKESFTRRAPQSTLVLTNSPAANYAEKSVAAGDNKFVWGIPRRDETVNPEIKQNPGW